MTEKKWDWKLGELITDVRIFADHLDMDNMGKDVQEAKSNAYELKWRIDEIIRRLRILDGEESFYSPNTITLPHRFAIGETVYAAHKYHTPLKVISVNFNVSIYDDGIEVARTYEVENSGVIHTVREDQLVSEKEATAEWKLGPEKELK